MLNELYHIATPWAKATKSQINVNRMLGVAANVLYPVYCAWSPLPKQKTTQGEKMVVSLTTFPLRIGKVHLTIQSILRQSRPADRVLLWLSKEEFPEEAQLPENLLRLKERGLDIRFCDNIRSFKKVFYTAQEFENDVIITVDDDVLYPENWLEGLWDTHEKYPGCVCCYRAHEITFEGGRVAPYQEWHGLSPDKKGPSEALFPVGVGGVLYPAGYFSGIEFNSEKILKLCPTADDMWLKIVGAQKRIPAVKVSTNSKEWFTIRNSQRQCLMSVNTAGRMLNDEALQNLMEYYHVTAEMLGSTSTEQKGKG